MERNVLLMLLPLNNSSASSNLYLQARLNLEQQLGHSIISKDKATDYLPPADSWDEQPNEIDDKEDWNQPFCPYS